MSVGATIDYPAFLADHDMTWNRLPNRWEVAPFSGNGMVGFLFYQGKQDAGNVISLHVGRHDYYDHRELEDWRKYMWILRGRLPLGRFTLESQGEITGVDLRLDLWNAELRGNVRTSKGSYAVRGLSHADLDVIWFEMTAAGGESVRISWHPEVPYSSTRRTLEKGGGPKGGNWDEMRTVAYPLPPDPTLSEEDGMQLCFQPLHEHRGETTTGWELTGEPGGKQGLIASVHHSFPDRNSRAVVKANIKKARALEKESAFIATHRTWWHAYYPKSFLGLNDKEKEAFYWIQMYKLGSSMRQDGPVQDLMGPWYHDTFWPMVWGDLNVQLQYWTHLVANRMDVGESLPNNLDKYAGNLEKNVPDHWKDSAAIGACFPQDLRSYDNARTPDMLAWLLHNYWLHCRYTGDRERMRNGLFPLLKKTMNGYLNYLRDNPVESDDGLIHFKSTWSPEYPGGWGQDINFTIALSRWTCQTLLEIDREHELNDPQMPEWYRFMDHVVGFQVDEHGLRIGKDIPFDKPHRHYSHLLGFYPLALITPDADEDAAMLRKTLDRWLNVSIHSRPAGEAVSSHQTGYTATGAASMYAWLGDEDEAIRYLEYFLMHRLVSPTTMYAEGNPVIESPFSFCTSMHDMLLQSWGGVIRVFPAVPKAWSDIAFDRFRAQGGFLVRAKRVSGKTEFVEVTSETGAPCRVALDIEDPVVTINGKQVQQQQIHQQEGGWYEVALARGERVTFMSSEVKPGSTRIEALPTGEADRHLFGLNDKTIRLTGHRYYYPDES